MPYLSLPNFNYDSGPRRIQSGPDHEGYVVLYAGVQSTGSDEGIVVAGAPLSGTITQGAWAYDANWRYVPPTLQTQSGSIDPTPYNAGGALDTYDGVRISTRNTVAGAQIASAIGPQPGSTVSRSEKYMYFGGAAPDNQNYSPYNTPEINLAAEGKTGGGVTHRTFESSLLTNVLGSQGTSDRSQWRYHQPVYCKTYTETRRSEVPGLMSTPLRAMYRGGSTSYSYNYGSNVGSAGGNQGSSPGPPGVITGGTGVGGAPQVGDELSYNPGFGGAYIEWRLIDNTTGGYTVVSEGVASTYIVAETIVAANRTIVAVGRLPDPSSPDGYGEEIVSPPVAVPSCVPPQTYLTGSYCLSGMTSGGCDYATNSFVGPGLIGGSHIAAIAIAGVIPSTVEWRNVFYNDPNEPLGKANSWYYCKRNPDGSITCAQVNASPNGTWPFDTFELRITPITPCANPILL